MGGIIEFDDPEWLAAGAVGEPGARTFLVQVESEDGDRITVLVEKQQVWVGDHQPRQGDAGLLPSGEACRGLTMPCRWEAEPSERRTDSIFQGIAICGIKLRPCLGVFG